MTGIPGVVRTQLERFTDERGFLSEVARTAALPVPVAQTSHSHSREGVLRGLHFHRQQSDVWYLSRGRAQVALVDLRVRTGAPDVQTLVLDAEDPETLLIPPGVAHGYVALTDIDMFYLTSAEWDPADEQGLWWSDPTFAIKWAITDPLLSERDRSNPPFAWHDIPEF